MHGTMSIRDEDLRLRACLRISHLGLTSSYCFLGGACWERTRSAAEHCVNAMLAVPWTLVLRLGPLVRAAAHQMLALLASECLVAAVMQGFGG